MKSSKPPLVLVATDFSDGARAALAWACRYAGRFGSRLLVLHVVHAPADDPDFYRRTDKDRTRPLEALAEKRLRKHLKQAAKVLGHPKALKNAKTLLVEGLPAARILEVAAKKQAALVVVGATGRSTVARLFVGSTAQKVVERCPVPVLVAKTGAPGPESSSQPEPGAGPGDEGS